MTRTTKTATKRGTSATKRRKRADDEIWAITPEQAGWYWIYNHNYDSVVMMQFADGEWQDYDCDGGYMREVIGGPLPYPTEAVIDSHDEHFDTFRYEEWPRCGFDPIWKMGEPETAADGTKTPAALLMDGYFWVKFVEKPLPIIVRAFEGYLSSLSMEGEDRWDHADPDLGHQILFGPLIPPDVFSVESRDPERARLARANMPWRQSEVATSC